MQENRLSGSEGGGAYFRSPYPYSDLLMTEWQFDVYPPDIWPFSNGDRSIVPGGYGSTTLAPNHLCLASPMTRQLVYASCANRTSVGQSGYLKDEASGVPCAPDGCVSPSNAARVAARSTGWHALA
jgi:hypothetical protein